MIVGVILVVLGIMDEVLGVEFGVVVIIVG